MEGKKIKNFTDLIAWQKGRQLVIEIYKICKDFPDDERYVLSSQIKRAVISITSNLAEGFNRKSLKEKIQFYSIANASLAELQNQIIIARDLEYVDEKKFHKIFNLTIDVNKIINGLIKSIKKI